MLAPEHFIQPRGRIAPGLFPGEPGPALDARFRAYIDVAYAHEKVAALAEAERDAPAASYVYHLAYTDIAQDFAAVPTRADLERQGSESYSPNQWKYFDELARHYLGVFDAAFAETTVELDQFPSGPTANRYTY